MRYVPYLIGIFLLGTTSFLSIDYLYTRKKFNEFFQNEHDLAWGTSIANREVNFCTIDWPGSSAQDSSIEDVDLSPSRRYRAKIQSIGSDKQVLRVTETESGRLIFQSEYDASGIEVRWIFRERYIVYMLQVRNDDDFAIAKVFLGDLVTGKMLYLTNATHSSCGEYADLSR